MAKMAILQEVDKCIRCNGCVISCKRTWHMKAKDPGVIKVQSDSRVMIKSQMRVDNAPHVRYSCWHCANPPCIGTVNPVTGVGSTCPFDAIKKQASGAVSIDPNKCKPLAINPANGRKCNKGCTFFCGKGGYPKVGTGSDLFLTDKAWKCTLCTGFTGAVNSPYKGAGFGGDLPTKAPLRDGVYKSALKRANGTYYSDAQVDEIAHQPSCVYTCPAKAMVYDTRDNIWAYITDAGQGWMSKQGDPNGSMFWASRKYMVLGPKADPFMEDHISPMVGSLLSGPFAKAALVPTLVVGGLMALSARRSKVEEETLAGEVR